MRPVADDPVRVEDGAKRVRVFLGGEVVADTTQPKLVWENPYYPAYYFPIDDVRTELLTRLESTDRSPTRGTATLYDVKGGTRTATVAARRYADSPVEALRDLVRFDWEAMDAWFEEDEEVHVHPRDPHTRVDILHSSRHVEVFVRGEKVADSQHPTLLFETGLPVRYYLPKLDVRMDLLTPTDTRTRCPYKGTAEYWSVTAGGEVHTDLVWSYPAPLPESQKIVGLVAFYDERVDLVVDGVPQPPPKTRFS